jgi:hypothetical protein
LTQVLRKLLIGVAVIATMVAGVGTARLVVPRTDPTHGVVKQLAFLRAQIEGGADHAAQKQFPEGYFFLNALYGLTWVQVGLADPDRSVDATAEARWALDRLQSADGTGPFDRDRFVTGVGVREYPKGVGGKGDVDSGPLILGLGLSASVVTMGAARVQHDPLADRLAREGDLLGLPLSGLTTKRYLFGTLPIGDAFLAWSASARPLVADDQPKLTGDSYWWRLPWLPIIWLLPLILWVSSCSSAAEDGGERPETVRRRVGACSGSRRGMPGFRCGRRA